MKKYSIPMALSLVVILASCSTPKTYFTSQIRTRVEKNSIPLTKLQYYIDQDVELRRELIKGETKVTSGKVKFVDGKYLNIIVLKKNTPGVCTMSSPERMQISFEMGDGKSLTFGKTKNAQITDPYRILANNWVNDYGIISYEGKQYYIASGGNASILINTSALKTEEVNKREMKGRTVGN